MGFSNFYVTTNPVTAWNTAVLWGVASYLATDRVSRSCHGELRNVSPGAVAMALAVFFVAAMGSRGRAWSLVACTHLYQAAYLGFWSFFVANSYDNAWHGGGHGMHSPLCHGMHSPLCTMATALAVFATTAMGTRGGEGHVYGGMLCAVCAAGIAALFVLP